MSPALAGGLIVLAAMLIGVTIGLLLSWWVIGHNPFHKGRCP